MSSSARETISVAKNFAMHCGRLSITSDSLGKVGPVVVVIVNRLVAYFSEFYRMNYLHFIFISFKTFSFLRSSLIKQAS